MLTKELLDKFLNNECSNEDLEQVAYLLENEPGLIEDWLPESEFVELDPKSDPVPDERRLIKKVIGKTVGKQAVLRVIHHCTVVASFLVLLILGVRFSTKRVGTNHIFRTGIAAEQIAKKTTWRKWRSLQKPLIATLPDKTIVELAPFSELQIDSSFGLYGQRNTLLTGKAFFKVAKDKSRPFAVYTGDIVTIALGTSFTINGRGSSGTITVLLHTGKVLVKAVNGRSVDLQVNNYLDPGDLLMYYNGTKQSLVKRHLRIANVLKPGKAPGLAEKVYKPDWYHFEEQSLSAVIDQLSFYYQVPITYNKEDIRRNFMTAKFNVTDHLDKILKDIAIMNRLSVRKMNGQYYLKKIP